MYSRRGKSTINNYLCFSKDPEEIENKRAELVKLRARRLRKDEMLNKKSSVE